MSEPQEILVEQDGRVVTITFNRPEARNAMTFEMYERLHDLCERFDKDAGVRVLVLTGAGDKAFVSGTDIRQFLAFKTKEDALGYESRITRVLSRIHAMTKPTIAMIQGYCIGGGLNLAIGCDLRFCTEGSRFALPAAKLGLGYGYAGLQRFIDTVGPANTKDIFFSARQFGAAEALAMGVVNKVLPEAELAAFVKDYAGTIAENAPLTIAAVKQSAIEALKPESERNLKLVADMVARCFASQDYIEGRTAFMEKRKPKFSGK